MQIPSPPVTNKFGELDSSQLLQGVLDLAGKTGDAIADLLVKTLNKTFSLNSELTAKDHAPMQKNFANWSERKKGIAAADFGQLCLPCPLQ